MRAFVNALVVAALSLGFVACSLKTDEQRISEVNGKLEQMNYISSTLVSEKIYIKDSLMPTSVPSGLSAVKVRSIRAQLAEFVALGEQVLVEIHEGRLEYSDLAALHAQMARARSYLARFTEFERDWDSGSRIQNQIGAIHEQMLALSEGIQRRVGVLAWVGPDELYDRFQIKTNRAVIQALDVAALQQLSSDLAQVVAYLDQELSLYADLQGNTSVDEDYRQGRVDLVQGRRYQANANLKVVKSTLADKSSLDPIVQPGIIGSN